MTRFVLYTALSFCRLKYKLSTSLFLDSFENKKGLFSSVNFLQTVVERICSYDRLQAVLDLYYKIMGKLNNFLMCKNDFRVQSRCPTIWFHYCHFLFSMRQSFKETIRAINRAAQCLNKDDIGDYSTLTTLFLCECLRMLSVICCIFVSSSRPKRQMKSKDEIQNKK